MTENTPYQQLTRTFQRLSRFSHLAAIAGWDMFAMMPPGGSVARGEALAELGVLQHQILTDKKVGQWLQEARQQDLNDVEQANLREMQRQYDQAALLPGWWKQNRWPAAAASMPGAANVPPMTGRALPTTYARWSD